MLKCLNFFKRFHFQWSWTIIILPLCLGLYGVKYCGWLRFPFYSIAFLAFLFIHEIGRSLVFLARDKSVTVLFSGLGARWRKGDQLFSIMERVGACFSGWVLTLLLFLIFSLLACITHSFSTLLFEVFYLFAEVNLYILIINLFPAKPLDMGYLIDTIGYAALQELGSKIAFGISLLSYLILLCFLCFIGKGLLGIIFLINLIDDFRLSRFFNKKEMYY